ncbi:MAG: penicillin-binding protein 2 [bacterium]
MQRDRNYKARVFFVFLGIFCLYGIIVARLFLLQIYQKDFFKILARHQHYLTVSFEPDRAEIRDKNGTLLAFNKEVPSAFVLPRQLQDKARTKKFLKQHYPQVYQRMMDDKKRHFLWVERKLTPDRLQFLKQATLQDIQFVQETQRYYPFKEFSHVIGFTDIDNNGISGIELEFSKQLQGTSITMLLSKDARSKSLYFDKSVIQKGDSGKPLALTLDHRLQFLSYEHLQETIDFFKAKSGSVLVMNPDTGEILVMANYPTFDANGKILADLSQTKNLIVSECFEFGSVMKTFSALAILEEGVTDLDELVDCEGKIGYVDGFRIENWKSLDVLPFRDVVRFSSNVGIAKMVQRIGDKLYDHLIKIGFGKKTGILFPGEREGFVNNPANWSRSSLHVMSFGYEVMATMLQVALAMSVIANGGYLVKPILVQGQRQSKSKKLYSDKTLALMKEILSSVTGTNACIPGFATMGKTGTARLLVDGKYSDTSHIYTFAGIIENADYRRVVVSFIKEPERKHLWASDVAMPLFKKVAEKLAVHDMVAHQV